MVSSLAIETYLQEHGLETTLKRPIVNTRDEPHADREKYRRLHVIVGDSNMSEYTNFLKVATCSVVLQMIEDNFINKDFTLRNPVKAIKDIKVRFKVRDGKVCTVGKDCPFSHDAQRVRVQRERRRRVPPRPLLALGRPLRLRGGPQLRARRHLDLVEDVSLRGRRRVEVLDERAPDRVKR